MFMLISASLLTLTHFYNYKVYLILIKHVYFNYLKYNFYIQITFDNSLTGYIPL